MSHTLLPVLTYNQPYSESQHLICPVDVNRTPLLKLNVQKTQFCIFSNRKLLEFPKHKYCIITAVNQSILGVALDSDLSFHTHATDVATRANK